MHTEHSSSFPARKAAFIAAKILFLAGLVVLVFRPQTFGFSPDLFQNITPRSLLEVLRELDASKALPWLAFALAMKFGGIFSGILRWRLLLHAQGLPIPFWYLTKCWFMGRAIGLFLPGTVGLDGYRLVESARYTGEVAKCTAVLVVEKVIGFVVLFSVVFFILPHGLQLFEFKPLILAAVLLVLAGFITVALLLLFRPRAAQTMVAVLPAPAFLRSKIDAFGASLRLFSGQPGTILLAILFGYGIYAGILLMYYGAVNAVMPGIASFRDVMFAFALVTVGSIIGPTVSGAGVREAGFALVFGRMGAAAEGLVSGHFGLWLGEVFPFLLSLPLLIFTSRPTRETLEQRIQALRERSPIPDEERLHIAPEEVTAYRSKLIDAVGAGLLGGLIAGALAGFAEALWLALRMGAPLELQALWWGPVVYGLLFACVGAGIGAAWAFCCLVFDRFPRPLVAFVLTLAPLLTGGIWVLGRFRMRRDMLQDQALSFQQELGLLSLAAGIALCVVLVATVIAPMLQRRRSRALAAGLLTFLAVIAIGAATARILAAPAPAEQVVVRDADVDGPNVFLIVADALRADYMALYTPEGGVPTPVLESLAADGVFYEFPFAQGSWTKPGFGSLFSGVYPDEHGATGRLSMLSPHVTTIAEVLQEHRYYTKGFANNPMVSSVFNFDQGFDAYTELRPSLYFGAASSSTNLVAYQVLRRVRHMVQERLLGGRLFIRDFYQPAEVVADVTMDWVRRRTAGDGEPFFLFVHYMDPHDPFMDADRPGHGYARVRAEHPDPALAEPMAKAYRDEIAHMDRHIGRFLEYLKQAGLYDDALIIFTSDHGEEFYDHEGWWHGKTLYDEVIRVPLLVKFPGNRFAGETRHGLVRHIDLTPTIADAVGAPIPTAWLGTPLVTRDGVLLDATTDVVYSHNDFEGSRLRAVRTRDYKRIEGNEGNPRGLDPLEIYRVADDPLETRNLATDPAHENVLDSLFDRVLGGTRGFILEPVPDQAVPDEIREQMESLGYF